MKKQPEWRAEMIRRYTESMSKPIPPPPHPLINEAKYEVIAWWNTDDWVPNGGTPKPFWDLALKHKGNKFSDPPELRAESGDTEYWSVGFGFNEMENALAFMAALKGEADKAELVVHDDDEENEA